MPVSKIRGVDINWQVIGANGPSKDPSKNPIQESLGRHDQRRAAEL
jgi:hypothetical protein